MSETSRTCGQGLEEHSALPAKMGELIASLAANLEIHKKALDLADENSRRERDAYTSLATRFAEIARSLGRVAAEMAGYRDLPMGRHDPKAMAGRAAVEAFEEFVRVEAELLALVLERLEKDRAMLAAMGGVDAAAP
jgi:hypothetical protein